MSDLRATGKLKRATCSVIVTRADGTVEDLGIVADSKTAKRAWWRLWKKVT